MPEAVVNHAFDPARFDRDVAELGRYLADLKYIDMALGYIDQRHQMPGAGPGGPRYDWLDIPLGQDDYAFQRTLGRYAMPPGYAEQVDGDLAERATKARIWAEREVEALRFLTQEITYPDPQEHDFIATELERIGKFIGRINDDLGELSNNLSNWRGEQAESFAAFHSGHEGVVRHQIQFVFTLGDAVAASKAIVRLAQHSLASAVVATRDAVHEQLRKRSWDSRDPSKRDVLRIASAATAILAAISFQVAPLSAALSGLSVSLGYAASEIPEEQGDLYQVEGSTADDLAASLFESVGQIATNFHDHCDELDMELRGLDPTGTDDQGKLLFFHPRPDLADGADPDEFQFKY